MNNIKETIKQEIKIYKHPKWYLEIVERDIKLMKESKEKLKLENEKSNGISI